MKKMLFMSMFATTLILGACGNDDETNEENEASAEKNEAEDIQSSNEVDEPADEVDGVPVYDIGQTARVERESGVEYQVTLNSVDFVTEYNGESAGDTADLGTRIALADYTVLNTGDQPLVPDFDTVIHFGRYDPAGGTPMEFDTVEDADSSLQPAEEKQMKVYVKESALLENGLHVAQFNAREPGEIRYKVPVEGE